ncbi:chitin synthase III catalytic subunit [Suillus clintonianus]|uniref:chitin synthase III catalytic subunit n=1 Tax=Suillus clintonianus TaxID=1904413 RepID=UPI001B86EABD|nr:chitin synthase III catalytic subunit [Suillus clintonianus]KAG2139219.1 chitin synthase III catalytic subunit [Suillus clintonianus]
MARFGDFQALCSQVPSYTWCNLFYRQLQTNDPTVLVGVSQNAASAPVGVNPECGIPKLNTNGSLGNIANIVACGLSIFIVGALIYFTGRRKAAVGRVELRIFFALYLLTLPFQLITTGSLLTQGTTALVVLTAIHAGLVATLFWTLLANAIVATQIVEDGTLSSIVPFSIISVAFFVATTYISLDVGLTITHVIGTSNPPQSINSIPLFVLTSIWPGVAALIYFGIMLYIVLGILNEIRPVWYYVIAAILFVLSQLDYFLLNKIICRGSSMKVDGSFIATILETACVVALYFAWRGITEEDWDNDLYYPS